MVRQPIYGDKVSVEIAEIIEKYKNQMTIQAIDQLSHRELNALITCMETTTYGLNYPERRCVMNHVYKLAHGYRSAWKRHSNR